MCYKEDVESHLVISLCNVSCSREEKKEWRNGAAFYQELVISHHGWFNSLGGSLADVRLIDHYQDGATESNQTTTTPSIFCQNETQTETKALSLFLIYWRPSKDRWKGLR